MNLPLRLAFAAVACLFSSQAFAAENIECASSGFSPGDQSVIDKYVENFTQDTLEDLAAQQSLIDVVSGRVDACAAELEWSEAASEEAFAHATTSVDERAIRQRSPQASLVVDRIDSELPAEDRERVWRIIGNIADSQRQQSGQATPEEDLVFLGGILLQLDPEGEDSNDQYTGALMAMIVLKREAQAEFAKL